MDTETLLDTNGEICRNIKARKTKDMVIPRQEDAGQDLNIQILNRLKKTVAKFEYAGNDSTNKSTLHPARN